MPEFAEFYKARDIITEIMEKDLIGPVKEDECLSELPVSYYIMGKLYPQNDTEEVIDTVQNSFLENNTETYDASISLSNQKNPSSMGVTFALLPSVNKICISGKFAFYRPELKDETEDTHSESEENKSDLNKGQRWVRYPYEYSEEIDLRQQKKLFSVKLDCDMELQLYTHMILKDGTKIITVTLINNNRAQSSIKDTSLLTAFQPSVKISGPNKNCIFSSINYQENLTIDPELAELEMLYSDTDCFAQGHGCSIEWDNCQEPKWISSSWFPSYNLQQMMAAQVQNEKVLSMKFLSEGDPDTVIKELRDFIDSYNAWIWEQESLAEKLDAEYKNSARENINKCKLALERISHSIDLLEVSYQSDNLAFKAFQLANEAMYIQRIQTLSKNAKSFKDESIIWYPFQLAFILHELSSFIDPDGDERKFVDLLWFPTGGGKTEAYLGITAFTIFLRRLRNPDDDGVTVIMRYTLRLLTLQQFERASVLICACELLRGKYNLKGSEISVGLWVGNALIPNKLSDAKSSINKQKAGTVGSNDKSNPCQIKICPWCGQPLTVNNYSITSEEDRMIIKCSNPKCSFYGNENGLPIHLIDQQIYKYLPTFLIATIDKFAQIPLSDKPASLFGITNNRKPPELIIQDELHLISGPLGTISGLYEAAITKLCERDSAGAKIIASTATIRNARNQIKALYGKDFMQFPPQGISAKDSYFAVESTPANRPARKYVGVMGIGTTATTTLIRVNAALLFATRYLAQLGFEDEIVDNFWTITGYFNSLRELGGACTQILDDVQSRFVYLAKTKFKDLKPGVNTDIRYDYLVELTSRMSNSEITEIIQDRLKRSYHNGKHSDVYDFVLASNMISVGVDVGRLGTMVVAGQPKTNSEYIQATSRVGRDNPGLVVTVYNPARSRDRSHYEQFIKYHSALYRYVEATSLTPFADRARDRGLHALYVSLCRYLVPGLLGNSDVVNYNPNNKDIQEIENLILEYVKKVDPDEYNAVKAELKDIENEWSDEISPKLVYKNHQHDGQLLKSDLVNDRFSTMNSMRSVDAQSGIYLYKR